MKTETDVDVVVIGGGPAGLSAALNLGRARKQVLLCDAGPPRNARPSTSTASSPATAPRPRSSAASAASSCAPTTCRCATCAWSASRARARLPGGARGRRLGPRATCCSPPGMVDVLPDLPGYRELWGKSIFQCPYCHGWEVRDRPWGVLATSEHLLEFAVFLTGWTRDVVAFTDGAFPVPAELRAKLERAGRAGLEDRGASGAAAASGEHGHLEAVELEDGTRVPREVLFARPPQRQPALVQGLVQGLGSRWTSRASCASTRRAAPTSRPVGGGGPHHQAAGGAGRRPPAGRGPRTDEPCAHRGALAAHGG